MNRREFLGQAALAAASLSACSSLNARTTPDSPVARARTPKKVIVIGAGLAGLGAGYELTQAGHDVAIDRKSTRLNSSHEWISYAVFCLKKKKKNQTQHTAQTKLTKREAQTQPTF